MVEAKILIVWVVAYTRVRAGGLSAEAEPGTVERAIATRLVRLSIPGDAKRLENPFRGATAWRTADHYADHCAACHGTDGHGRTVVGQGMSPKTPDFADATIQGMSDGELFYVIQNGVRWTGMPSWKREHSPDETWRLVSFIRAVPTLTPADLQSAGLGTSMKHHDHHDGPETDAHPHPKH
jgi:cytochrome c